MPKKDNVLLRTNLLICLIIVIGFLSTALLSYQANYSASLKNIEEVSSLTSESIYYQLTTTFSKPIHVSLTMANDSLLREYVDNESQELSNQEYTDTIAHYLNQYQKKYNYDSVFLISTKSRRYYNFNGIDRLMLEDNLENVWYYQFLESNEDYSLNVDNDEAAHDDMTVFINCKVRDEQNQVMAVVGVGVKLESLQTLFEEYEKQFGVNVCLVDSDGKVQISPKNLNENYFEIKNLEEKKEEILKHNDEAHQFWTKNYNTQHNDNYMVSRYIEDLSWHLIIDQDNGSVIQSFRNQLSLTIFIIIAIIIGILMIVTKVIKEFNKQVQQREEAFRTVTEKLYDNIYELNITNNCTANASTQRYFTSLGVGVEIPYDESIQIIAQKQIKKEFREGYIKTFCTENVLKQYALGNTDLRYDFMMSEDGIHYYWTRIDARIYYNKEDDCVHMFTYRKSIDQEKRIELEMAQLAHYDKLTNLYNRGSTQLMIEKMLSQNTNQMYAFFILDIDNFKSANDLYGHSFGDHVLVEFSRILKESFRSQDVVGRLGGDEFITFLPIPSLSFVENKASRVLNRLNEEVYFEGDCMKISASIGISIAPRDGIDFVELYKKADKALYDSKKKGRNIFTIYDSESESHK